MSKCIWYIFNSCFTTAEGQTVVFYTQMHKGIEKWQYQQWEKFSVKNQIFRVYQWPAQVIVRILTTKWTISFF